MEKYTYDNGEYIYVNEQQMYDIINNVDFIDYEDFTFLPEKGVYIMWYDKFIDETEWMPLYDFLGFEV